MQLHFEESERARFGYRMARLTLDSACEPADAEKIMKMCRISSVEMLTMRVPTEKIALVQALEALEFRSMDCIVYYKCPTEDLPAVKLSAVEIREATGEESLARCRRPRKDFAAGQRFLFRWRVRARRST